MLHLGSTAVVHGTDKALGSLVAEGGQVRRIVLLQCSDLVSRDQCKDILCTGVVLRPEGLPELFVIRVDGLWIGNYWGSGSEEFLEMFVVPHMLVDFQDIGEDLPGFSWSVGRSHYESSVWSRNCPY